MNKSELIAKIHEHAAGKLTKAEAELALDSLIATFSETLAAKEDISLVGFGSFKTTTRAERMGRNPQSGAEMLIPAATTVKFTPGKALKDAVNK